ncbi:hypothetical protein R3P38DRAFT_3184978 [Favolaschia claudopus]|uniref:Uncharacterized protein n=1 Tax=Favolaschia claudopus TaxID=2862362 RepID=A0AAW0C915_9AGAR
MPGSDVRAPHPQHICCGRSHFPPATTTTSTSPTHLAVAVTLAVTVDAAVAVAVACDDNGYSQTPRIWGKLAAMHRLDSGIGVLSNLYRNGYNDLGNEDRGSSRSGSEVNDKERVDGAFTR